VLSVFGAALEHGAATFSMTWLQSNRRAPLTPEKLNLLIAIGSIAGAFVSGWVLATRQYRLGARLPLSPLWAETVKLISTALLADHPMWSCRFTAYGRDVGLWWDSVLKARLALGEQGYRALEDLQAVLQQVGEEAFGQRRVCTGDPEEDDGPPRAMTSQSRAALNDALARFSRDPHLLTR
jgi:hypothetical protein